MRNFTQVARFDLLLVLSIAVLILISVLVLNSIAPSIFPLYYIFIVLGILSFLLFSRIEFPILSLFSRHLYVLSILLLILPIVIGQVTRGAVRWIPVGSLTLQPSEIVRPFLLLIFAVYLTKKTVKPRRLFKSFVLLLIPVILILIQPSLGVTMLTIVGYVGVVLATNINKKYLLYGALVAVLFIPFIWLVLAPYQKQRITSFLDTDSDPYGAGYNSIHAMISVGSGKLFGRGLGKGVQTQLSFLPERQTDFVFSSTAEELGLVGALILVIALFMVLWRLVFIVENSVTPSARAFASGLFLTIFTETLIHIGMNMGMLPITGVPLPLVSAGGSSFVATMIGLGIASSANK